MKIIYFRRGINNNCTKKSAALPDCVAEFRYTVHLCYFIFIFVGLRMMIWRITQLVYVNWFISSWSTIVLDYVRVL